MLGVGNGQSTAAGVDVHHDDHTSGAVDTLWPESQTQPEGAQPPAAWRLRDHDCCGPLLRKAWHATGCGSNFPNLTSLLTYSFAAVQSPAAGRLWDHNCCRPLLCKAWHATRWGSEFSHLRSNLSFPSSAITCCWAAWEPWSSQTFYLQSLHIASFASPFQPAPWQRKQGRV